MWAHDVTILAIPHDEHSVLRVMTSTSSCCGVNKSQCVDEKFMFLSRVCLRIGA